MKSLLLSVLLFAFLPQTDFKQYTNKEYGFSMSYPGTWEMEMIQNVTFFKSPMENEGDPFRENVNIMLQDLTASPMTLKEFTDLSLGQFEEMKDMVSVISVTDAKLAGQPAKQVVYTMDYSGTLLKLKQYWFVKGNIAYVLTFTALADKYTKYEEAGSKLMLSLKFK